MSTLTRFWKAGLAFVAPGAAILLVELAGDGIQSDDLWKAGLTAVVTAAAVGFGPANKPARTEAGDL